MSGADAGAERRFRAALMALRERVIARLLEAMGPEADVAPSATMVSAATRFLRENADALAPPPPRNHRTRLPGSAAPAATLFDADADPDAEDDPDAAEEDRALDQALVQDLDQTLDRALDRPSVDAPRLDADAGDGRPEHEEDGRCRTGTSAS